MFIEVTNKGGVKSIINSKDISELSAAIDGGTKIVWIPRQTRSKELFVTESYEDMKTMIKAKWVAE